jgi:hypothetical protein
MSTGLNESIREFTFVEFTIEDRRMFAINFPLLLE